MFASRRAPDPLDVHMVPRRALGWPTRLPGCVQRPNRREGWKRCEAYHPPDHFTAEFEGRFRCRAQARKGDTGDCHTEHNEEHELRPCEPHEPVAHRLFCCWDVGNLRAKDCKDSTGEDDWPASPLEHEPAPVQPAFSPGVAEPTLHERVDRDPKDGNRHDGREETTEAHVSWLKARPKIQVREEEIQCRGEAEQ